MNGWEFLDKLKVEHQEKLEDLNIVILSASENPRDITKFYSYSFVKSSKTH